MTEHGSRTTCVPHTANRLIVEVDTPFEEFQAQFEAAMPAARAADFFSGAATWDEARKRVAAVAPFGMIQYVKGPVGDAFALAGHHVRCAYYIVGNFSEADAVFARDPSTFQYMPFHVFLQETPSGGIKFCFDQPSSTLSVFDDHEITQGALRFDRHFVELLEHLGAPVPPELIP
jgi:hypothetical protein